MVIEEDTYPFNGYQFGMLALVRADDQSEVLPGKKEPKSRRPLT
jgi:hypothetical protein